MNSSDFAPIVLFVYDRLWHTEQTIDALKKNHLSEESDLIIFSDAAKNNESYKKVQEVREYIKTINGFKLVKVIERDSNYGLANSIIEGVTGVVNEYGEVIVLEDDLVTSPYFLTYMNDYLSFYKDDLRVGCIHGYVYPINGLTDSFFLKGADCWGWATWSRAWSVFEPDGKKLLDEIEREGHAIDPFNINMGYTKMLKDQIFGVNNSWAIRWYFSALIKDLYCLYPAVSHVNNIGLDETGTHCNNTNMYNVTLADQYEFIAVEVMESKKAKKEFSDFFMKKSLFSKLISKFRRAFL